MSARKIALIIFLIGLIVLSIGLIVAFNRNQSRQANLQADKLNQPPAATANNQPVKSAASGGQLTEQEIQQKIDAKKAEIKAAAKGRAYNNEELFFLSFPREAVLQEAKK